MVETQIIVPVVALPLLLLINGNAIRDWSVSMQYMFAHII